MEEWLKINILDEANLNCMTDKEVEETFKQYHQPQTV